jgi:STIMATE family
MEMLCRSYCTYIHHLLHVNISFQLIRSTMGLFPITMNILQFWLIDSIVKASTPTSVALENSPNTSRYPDREPLFSGPSDDEDDEDGYRRRDVENQHPLPRSLSKDARRQINDKTFTGSSTPDEHKSLGSTSDQAADTHSYPPSLSNSMSSNTSSSSNQSHGSPRPAHNLLKKAKRRPAPAPLSIRSAHTPAVNSPNMAPPPQAAPPPVIPIIAPVPEVGNENEGWAQTWEESDDWEHRVGDEDSKVDHTNLGNAWGRNPIIRVSS